MRAASPSLHILWDDSHIWGVIAAKAARAMRLPHRLILGRDIARGLFERERPAMLLVPGGNARHKAQSLGSEGMEAIRAYVRTGGRYLGFCGGAGLALNAETAELGLGLCPWKRGRFDERLQHFMSGHLHVALPDGAAADGRLVPGDFPASPRLPVWWPGRFAPSARDGLTILASYERPAADFWLADLAIADLPPDTFAAWHDLYGVSMNPAFLAGQPCLVHGRFGEGEYVLSYSHLETPGSPEANRWLAHLFRSLAGFEPAVEHIPAWRMRKGTDPENGAGHTADRRWDDPLLERMEHGLETIRQTGLKHGLLFERTDWLMGWRSGIPGASLNNLWSALRVIRESEPNEAAGNRLAELGPRLAESVSLFAEGCTQYFLAERLSQTVSRFMPDAVSPGLLNDQRTALFGPPMQAGGLYKAVMDPLDELALLQLQK